MNSYTETDSGSRTDPALNPEELSTSGHRVGVGLIPSEASNDALCRALLRAAKHEYQPLLIRTPVIDKQAVSFAQQLEIPVIEPPAELDDESGYHTTLEVAAEAAGMQHLVVHDEVTEPIDYERTKQTVEREDEFVIKAVKRSQPPGTETVAAIPAFNEAAAIEEVINATAPHVDEVLVVDDGSEDDTAALADAAGATVVEHGTNQGYGAALNTVFTTAAEWDVEQLVVLDGDGQHDSGDIPTLLDRLTTTNSEVVVGSRLTPDGDTDIPLYRRFGLGIVNVLTNVSLGITSRDQWIRDTQSGFRAYDRTAIESLAADDSISSGMDASTDIINHSHRQGYDIHEVGTTISYDVEEASSQGPVSHGLKLVSNLLTTIERDRPVLFIGLPGFVLTLVGILIGYLTISKYITNGAFPLGLALGSSVIFLTGLFMGLTATMLHALKQYLNNDSDFAKS